VGEQSNMVSILQRCWQVMFVAIVCGSEIQRRSRPHHRSRVCIS